MKVLFVTYHYLHGHGGSVFASRAYINAFAALSQRMSLLCPVTRKSGPEGLAGGIEIIPVFRSRNPLIAVRNYALGVLHRYYGLFRRVLQKGGFDTVVFDTCYASWRLIGQARKAGCRVVTIHHNFQQEFVRDNYTGIARLRLSRLTRRCEKAAVLGSDLNITLTEPDRKLLQDAYDPSGSRRFVSIGVFESVPVLKPALDGPRSEGAFLITGNLSYPQTEQSLLPWLDRYWPLLRNEVPESQLTVAGANPSPRLREACAASGVSVVANPPDMAPLLAAASGYICPTSLGGGIKLRIMDGLRYGLPVLTHTVSARGYETLLGRCVFAYDDEESFIGALHAMMETASSPEEIRREYLAFYGFEAGCERLRNCLNLNL